MYFAELQGQMPMQGPPHPQSKRNLGWLTMSGFLELGIAASPHAIRVWTAKRGPRSIKETPGL